MYEVQFQALVRELTALPWEPQWVELKHNKAVPEEICEHISTLSASALNGTSPSASRCLTTE